MKKVILIMLILFVVSALAATTSRKFFDVSNSDGTTFNSSDSTGAAIRIWNYKNDIAGGDKYLSGNLKEACGGIWYYDIDTDSSGYYYLERYTDAVPSWSAVSGYNPILILVSPPLLLTGGTMSGDIVMGDNAITGIDTIGFTDTNGTIAGIENGNLVDKSDTETISGAWTYTGLQNFDEDKLLVDSDIVNPYTYVMFSQGAAANISKANSNHTIFNCDYDYAIDSISVIYETAEATAATCYLQLERLSGTEETGAGDDILDNNSNSGIDMKCSARSIQEADLDNTNKSLSAGDRIGVLLSADSTELAGLCITIRLKRR